MWKINSHITYITDFVAYNVQQFVKQFVRIRNWHFSEKKFVICKVGNNLLGRRYDTMDQEIPINHTIKKTVG